MACPGMCNAGRTLNPLKRNLWKLETHMLIVGYHGHGFRWARIIER